MNQRRKEAHKAATNMYDQERKKRRTDPTRLSAAAVGNQDRRGGRPSVSFFDPNIPQAGQTVSKSSVTNTLICGSSAGGETLPPHFQF